MKKYLIPAMLLTTLIMGTSCGNNSETSESTSGMSGSDTSSSSMTTDQSATGSSAGSTGDTGMDHSSATNSMAGDAASDSTFVMMAASGGLMEVQLGKLAQTKASAAEVKNFGSKMVTDHTKANAELKTIAAAKNMTLPTAPAAMHQNHINEMKGKSGAEFDKAYMNLMVNDHQEDVSAFEKQANNGNDTQIKAFAAKTLPVLKMHHEMAKTINGKMK